jgi:tetratricopeptide (TPR) repeat protein
MKRELLAAVVALSLTGCERAPPVEPVKVTVTVPPPRAPAPIAKVPRPAAPEPAPALETPAPVDPLVAAHEPDAGVDHLERAKAMRERGDLAGALVEARRALHHDPLQLEALGAVERLAKLTGDRQLAAVALERMAILQPEETGPWLRLARTRLGLKDFSGALAAGTEALARDPDSPEAFQVLGRAHLNRGELKDAIAMFERAIALDGRHGYALNNLGFAYLRANENAKAVEVLQRASEVLPQVAYVHNNLGVALERTGDVEGAKQAYSRSSFLSPKYVKAKVNAQRIARASVEPLEGDFAEEAEE